MDHDLAARSRSFREDETVYMRNFGLGRKCLPGTIVATTQCLIMSCWRMVVSEGDTRTIQDREKQVSVQETEILLP